MVFSDSVTCAEPMPLSCISFICATCFFFLPIIVVSYVRKLHKRKTQPILQPSTHTISLGHTFSKNHSGAACTFIPCHCHALVLAGWCVEKSYIKTRSQLTISVHSILTAEKRSSFRSVFQFLNNTFLLAATKESLFILFRYMNFCVTVSIV